MNDFTAQDGTIKRDNQVFMVVNRVLPLLRVHIGDDWVLASFEESADLSVEIQDVLVGPL